MAPISLRSIGRRANNSGSLSPGAITPVLLLPRQHRTAAVIVLDAQTGTTLWQRPLELRGIDMRRAGLPVADGRVYCSEGGEEPAVRAFDAKTSKLLWRAGLGKQDGACAITPIVAGGKVFAATRATHGRKSNVGATVALEAATGKLLWRRKGVYPTVSLSSDGRVVACGMFLSGEDDKFHLLDAQTGDTVWTAPRRFHYAPATLTDKLAFVCGPLRFPSRGDLSEHHHSKQIDHIHEDGFPPQAAGRACWTRSRPVLGLIHKVAHSCATFFRNRLWEVGSLSLAGAKQYMQPSRLAKYSRP